MVAFDFSTKDMHRVRTYDEIIHDDVLFPTDKINLPDRMATRLRNLPQLTRFDEIDATVDMAADQEKVAKARVREQTFKDMGVGPDDTQAIMRAQNPTSDFDSGNSAEDIPADMSAMRKRPKGLASLVPWAEVDRGIFGRFTDNWFHDGKSPYERAHCREISRQRQEMDDKRDRARRARGEAPEPHEEQPRHFQPAPETIHDAAIAEFRQTSAALTRERLREHRRREALAAAAQANLSPANSVIEHVLYGGGGYEKVRNERQTHQERRHQDQQDHRCTI